MSGHVPGSSDDGGAATHARRPLIVAAVQTDPTICDVASNLTAAEALIRAEADHREATGQPGVDLWLLPELAFSGYLFVHHDEVEATAEQVRTLDGRLVGGPITQWLQRMAGSLDAAVGAGFVEADGDRRYNSAILTAPEGVLLHYRKVHLYAEECRWFDPGDLGFPTTIWRGCHLGMMVCFDWMFPEAARTLALAGAELILHPANLVLPHCPDAMVTRALENRVWCLTSDRCGEDDRGHRADGATGRLTFQGQSQLVSPGGEIVGRLGREGEGVLVAQVEPGEAARKRLPQGDDVLGDRRLDQYWLGRAGGAPARGGLLALELSRDVAVERPSDGPR